MPSLTLPHYRLSAKVAVSIAHSARLIHSSGWRGQGNHINLFICHRGTEDTEFGWRGRIIRNPYCNEGVLSVTQCYIERFSLCLSASVASI